MENGRILGMPVADAVEWIQDQLEGDGEEGGGEVEPIGAGEGGGAETEEPGWLERQAGRAYDYAEERVARRLRRLARERPEFHVELNDLGGGRAGAAGYDAIVDQGIVEVTGRAADFRIQGDHLEVRDVRPPLDINVGSAEVQA